METPQAMPKNVQIGYLDTTFAISYSYNIISTKKKKYRCSNLCKAKRNFQGKKSESEAFSHLMTTPSSS